MISLLVVRHGQSEWNLAGKWQGQADPPLTPLGERQAEVAAEALAELLGTAAGTAADTVPGALPQESVSGGPLRLVISSDLQRASRTAQIMATALGVADVVTDPALRERDAGEWEGLTKAEIDRDWPGDIAARRWPPNFESEQCVADRVLPALRQLLDGLGARDVVLAIGHAGLLKTLDLYAGTAEVGVPNLSGRWYEVDTNAADWGWEQVKAGEQVELVASDVDLSIE